MDYVFLIVGSLVILTCFYFIISPFFNASEKQAVRVDAGEEKWNLEQVYSAVNELEMDFLMEKITRDDFDKMKEQYQLLAAGLMKEGPRGKQPGKTTKLGNRAADNADEAEAEILRELQKLRRQKG